MDCGYWAGPSFSGNTAQYWSLAWSWAQSFFAASNSANGPAITALCITALRESGVNSSDPAIKRGLKYLKGFVQPSGGVHHPQSLYRNYETSLAILCFSTVNDDGSYDKTIQNADKFLKGIQWDEDESIDRQ